MGPRTNVHRILTALTAAACALPADAGEPSRDAGSSDQKEIAPEQSLPAPDARVTVYFLVDASGSMNQAFRDEVDPKIAEVRMYLTEAVRNLASHPGVEVVVKAFGPAGCGSVQEIGSSPDRGLKGLVRGIASMSAHGPSSLASALLKVDQEISGLDGAKFLVLLADGDDRCGGDLGSLSLSSEVTRHILGLSVDSETGGALLELGDYTEVRSADDLAAALSRVVGDILGSIAEDEPHSTSRYLGTPNRSLSTSSK